MDSKEIKKVVQQTEKELQEKAKEKQIKKVKEIVKRTLEKIDSVKKEKSEVDTRLKYLKMDLDDLKEGHLERIEERQSKDPEAKKYSVIIIIKETIVKEIPIYDRFSPWYWPYSITWNTDNTHWDGNEVPGNITFKNDLVEIGTNLSFSLSNTNCDYTLTSGNSISEVSGDSINCSVAKDFSAGTYQIGDKIVHFR